jgi:transposase
MASKRVRKKKSPRKQKAANDKHKIAKEALELSASAHAEIVKLLKEEQDGKITRSEMETGLEEVDERLKRLMIFINSLL